MKPMHNEYTSTLQMQGLPLMNVGKIKIVHR
jgi:hypothetical protein